MRFGSARSNLLTNTVPWCNEDVETTIPRFNEWPNLDISNLIKTTSPSSINVTASNSSSLPSVSVQANQSQLCGFLKKLQFQQIILVSCIATILVVLIGFVLINAMRNYCKRHSDQYDIVNGEFQLI